ncbi:MAG: DUF4143 domain-containing protein [Spirochaetota bacterium]
MNLLVGLLRERVANPLSYQGLAEDLGIAPNTVKRYLEVLEALYIIFRIYPHHRSIARSLQQQPKIYFFDTALVIGDRGKLLENLTALSLHRQLCLLEDQDGMERSLGYLRTKDGREVDFVLVAEGKPVLQVEVKTADRSISPGLRYFHEHYGIPAVQLVEDPHVENESGPIKLRRLFDWLERPGVKFRDSPHLTPVLGDRPVSS